MTTKCNVGVKNPDGTWNTRFVNSDGYTSGVADTLYHNYKRSYVGRLQAMVDRILSEPYWYGALCGKDLTMPSIWNRYPESYSMTFYYQHEQNFVKTPYVIGDLTEEASLNMIRWIGRYAEYTTSSLALLVVAEFAPVAYSACVESQKGYDPSADERCDHTYPASYWFDVARNLMIVELDDSVEVDMDGDKLPSQAESEYWERIENA